MKYDSSDALCEAMHERTGGRVMLAFSRGKDSIASWLQLRRHGYEVVPFYMYSIPGLQFEAESTAYYEEFFGCHIMRVPHPRLYRCLANGVFQAPQNMPVLDALQLPIFSYDDLHLALREDLDWPDAWIATGVRGGDSAARRACVAKSVTNEAKKTFFPIYDWTISQVREEIKSAGVKLPPDYQWFGRSFDGYQEIFLRPLREHAPEDYQRVLDFFPLAELEILRIDYRNAYWRDHGQTRN